MVNTRDESFLPSLNLNMSLYFFFSPLYVRKNSFLSVYLDIDVMLSLLLVESQKLLTDLTRSNILSRCISLNFAVGEFLLSVFISHR